MIFRTELGRLTIIWIQLKPNFGTQTLNRTELYGLARFETSSTTPAETCKLSLVLLKHKSIISDVSTSPPA